MIIECEGLLYYGDLQSASGLTKIPFVSPFEAVKAANHIQRKADEPLFLNAEELIIQERAKTADDIEPFFRARLKGAEFKFYDGVYEAVLDIPAEEKTYLIRWLDGYEAAFTRDAIKKIQDEKEDEVK